MKEIITISIFVSSLLVSGCRNDRKQVAGENPSQQGKEFVSELSGENFKKIIFDYEKNSEFKFEGDKPAIIDFYADWCAPCRQLSPIVESIAMEYSGKINVYKIDTEKERKLATDLGITALPTLMLIPMEGQPRASMGLMSKEDLVKAVNEILLVN
jgi:thioredoxin